MVYVFVFGAFLAPFTSLMASIDRPLIDAALERADRLLGFDWFEPPVTGSQVMRC
jgi:hypothetical protein